MSMKKQYLKVLNEYSMNLLRPQVWIVNRIRADGKPWGIPSSNRYLSMTLPLDTMTTVQWRKNYDIHYSMTLSIIFTVIAWMGLYLRTLETPTLISTRTISGILFPLQGALGAVWYVYSPVNCQSSWFVSKLTITQFTCLQIIISWQLCCSFFNNVPLLAAHGGRVVWLAFHIIILIWIDNYHLSWTLPHALS